MSELVELSPNHPEPSMLQDESGSNWGDLIGMVASIGCAIHCAAMPFVVASLPALGLSFLADEAFHQWMAVACFAIAVAAFVPGWRRHGRLVPGIIGIVGLTCISGAAFALPGECCVACASASAEEVSGAALCPDDMCDCCATATTDEPVEGNRAESTDDVPAPPTQSVDDLAVTESETMSPLLAGIAPWLTPVGGLILVAAHLLNRRFGCVRECCTQPAVDETE
ncbi:MAG: MerC domain-containing protein [Planctomycetota bacterium]